MIAALPMYDRPEIRAETDRFWAKLRDGLRTRGIDAPDALTRGLDPWEVWQSSDLVFAQTCGLPYRARLSGRVSLVAAPVHAGVPAGMYHSVIVKGPSPLGPAPKLAVNDALSQSGWANLANWLEASGITPGPVTVTGAHQASARAVYNGQAELAAIDAVTWGLMRRYDRWTDGLDVMDQTPPVPALPYIAPRGVDLTAYRAAFEAAIAALAPADRDALNLHGIEALSPEAYTDMPLPPPLPD